MADLYGPALPPDFAKAQSDEGEKDETTASVGSELPKSLHADSLAKNASVSVTYGPVLPPSDTSDTRVYSTDTERYGTVGTYGPELPNRDREIPENEVQVDKKTRE